MGKLALETYGAFSPPMACAGPDDVARYSKRDMTMKSVSGSLMAQSIGMMQSIA
jgi:hypothetical protein